MYLLRGVFVLAVAALTPARYTAASFTATPLTSFAPAVYIHIHKNRHDCNDNEHPIVNSEL
jgi:hypothetical protein